MQGEGKGAMQEEGKGTMQGDGLFLRHSASHARACSPLTQLHPPPCTTTRFHPFHPPLPPSNSPCPSLCPLPGTLPPSRPPYHGLRNAVRCVVRHQLLLTAEPTIGDCCDRLHDAGNRQHCRLHLSQLDAEAAQLDLLWTDEAAKRGYAVVG
eukprot:206302-Chlamydomonas_euryale.AAC.2